MKIVVLEFFDFLFVVGFCWEFCYFDDLEWVLVGGDFGFYSGIVGLVIFFYFVYF